MTTVLMVQNLSVFHAPKKNGRGPWKVAMRKGHQLAHITIPGTDENTTREEAEKLAKGVEWSWPAW